MWNLGEWYTCIYLQSKNGDTDIENKPMDIKGWGDGGLKREVGIDIYVRLCIKQITNENHCIAQEV